jgi:hypothetical protein
MDTSKILVLLLVLVAGGFLWLELNSRLNSRDMKNNPAEQLPETQPQSTKRRK